ncbi:hypothetical protein Aperf_G00000099864 [Anoplocephala perfoliata]
MKRRFRERSLGKATLSQTDLAETKSWASLKPDDLPVCSELEMHIFRLVDDPLTPELLRPRVVQCLRGYRSAGLAPGASVDVANAYNEFLVKCRHDLESNQAVSNRLAFWNDVIITDTSLAPISNEDVNELRVTPEEAKSRVHNPLKRISCGMDGDKCEGAQSLALIDELFSLAPGRLDSFVMSLNVRSPCQFYDVNGKPFRPTLKPYPNFDVNADVETLCKSMRGWGTNEDAIINILGRRTSEQRMAIVAAYKEKYGRELAHDLEGDLSGHFEDCCVLLTESPYYLMAKSLYYAFKGVGTNANTLLEIIVGCYNEELEKIKQEYIYVLRDKGVKDPKRTLESDLYSETSGYFCKMLLQMLKSKKADPTEDQIRRGFESIVDQNTISQAVKTITEALERPKNSMGSLFTAFSDKNSWELAAIEREYRRTNGESLVPVLPGIPEREFGMLLASMIEHAVDRPKFYAEALYYSMKGAGTHDFLLMRLIILRSEIDLMDIKETFDRDHKSLAQWITNDTSGDYRKLLLTLLNAS